MDKNEEAKRRAKMSIGDNEKKGTYNRRYEAWAANMLRASKPKQWDEIEKINELEGVRVTVETVGCLYWCYYSIMHYLGKGKSLQSVLSYCQNGKVIPNTGIDFEGRCDKKGFYKTEGQFCVSAVILVLLTFISKWQERLSISSGISWAIAAVVLFQVFLAFKSLAQGRRFGGYILNTILILLLSTGFGVIELLYLVGSAIAYSRNSVKSGVQYMNPDYGQKRVASTNATGGSCSGVGVNDYEKQQRKEEQWQREKEREGYQKKIQEDKEARRKEDQRYRLLKEIDSLKEEITILENKNKDLDAGYRAHQKGSWSYNVDPKANRSKYESNLKEIDWLKKKIEKIDDELRRL